MRIARFEHLHADAGWRIFSFLKIVTNDGLVGWAEYNEGYGAGGLTALLRKFADIVVGMDPREVGRISTTLHAMSRMAHGGLNAQAIAVIENACLDIKAKAFGIPVYALFGGPFRERIPLYWSHCGSRRVWRRDLFEDKWGFPPMRKPRRCPAAWPHRRRARVQGAEDQSLRPVAGLDQIQLRLSRHARLPRPPA